MNSNWLTKLNPEQVQAVNHNHGPMLILAGAGSGKTTVLVNRTGRLIEEKVVKPERVCVLTFTNKAARELKSRVKAKLGNKANKIWTGTFHSFGLELVRKFHKHLGLPKYFGILSQNDSQALIKECLRDIQVANRDGFDVEKIAKMISLWREKKQQKAKTDDAYEACVQVLLPKYLKKLRLLGVVDFEDLLLLPLELCEKFPELKSEVESSFDQVMVDEFQDTNNVQMRLVKLISDKHKNLSVVGDDDQSIYGWRGAEISNILNFPSLYSSCKVVRLERNYRSTPNILRVANHVIKNNKKRHGKILRPGKDSGAGSLPELFVFEDEEEECEWIVQEILCLLKQNKVYKDFALLYRSNSQGAMLEMELRRHSVPYKITGGTAFFDRKETKDILAYLRCAIIPNDVSLRRILNVPHRGIGETSIEKLAEYASEHGISFYKACKSWKKAQVSDRVGPKIDEAINFINQLCQQLVEKGKTSEPNQALLQTFIELGYKTFVSSNSKDALQAHKRWQMVEIFANVFGAFMKDGGVSKKNITDFVDALELRDMNVEEDDTGKEGKVQLLTFHACKGLEFPVCFMLGLEEDIIPHRTLGKDISEERRLFYVGVTRAQEKLILSRVRNRKRYGKLAPSAPSRFLLEIPGEYIKEFPNGVRPVTESERKNLISDLFQKIDQQKQ